eukprot:5737948-Heterocapsa_arctica.AAC.1
MEDTGIQGEDVGITQAGFIVAALKFMFCNRSPIGPLCGRSTRPLLSSWTKSGCQHPPVMTPDEVTSHFGSSVLVVSLATPDGHHRSALLAMPTSLLKFKRSVDTFTPPSFSSLSPTSTRMFS